MWDLTDAIDAGDATKAIVVARRMLESRKRAGLQIVSMLQRHYLNMSALEGSDARTKEEAAALLGVNAFPAGKSLQMSERLGRGASDDGGALDHRRGPRVEGRRELRRKRPRQ